MLRSSFIISVAVYLALSTLQQIQGAKILSLLTVVSPSHHVFNRMLSRALAARGHQVTVVSPDEDKPPLPTNLTYIKLEGVYELLHDNFDYEEFNGISSWSLVNAMNEWLNLVCEVKFKSEGAKKLMKLASSEKFDLIITEAGWGECFYGFVDLFGYPPVVGISAYGIIPWTASLMGTPDNPSYIPNSLLPYTSHMNLFQKLNNMLLGNFHYYNQVYRHFPRVESITEKYFNRHVPIFDIGKNFSLFLANEVPGLDNARPLPPNVIPVGGLHVKEKPDPLPKDIQEFLDGAKDGFIFFSLGSNARSDALPPNKLQALLQAFSELSQRVLWKFESDNLPGQPPNVKIGKWLPQSDILAHPNIRLFISHCGKLSSTESVFRGVPIVGIPLFADQVINIKKMAPKGIAVELDYNTLTKESVLKAVREVLYNTSYQTNMKKLSATIKDQPQTPMERAIFWIEFVIRHGGAPHLRPVSADMKLHEYLLLDVILFLAICVLMAFFVLYLIMRTNFRMIFNEPAKKHKVKEK